MKKYLIGSLFLLVGLMSYFLFENIFVWNFGWEVLPTATYTQKHISITDSTYAVPIVLAKKELEKIHRTSRAPAVSVGVSINGKIIWAQANGFMDVKGQIPATSETMFRIGSTSKALTGIVLGKLIQEQKIDLDQPIQELIPGFDDEEEISIGQVASHTSGIRHYGLCFCFPIWEYYSNKEYETVSSSLEIFKDDKLLFSPGSSFSYSTYNYSLLSAAMEKSTNVEFLQLVDQAFKELGMNQTVADQKDLVTPNRAKFYDISEDEFKEAFEVNLSYKWAGGGFLSTPSDLLKGGNVLLDSSYLSKETIELITTPWLLENGEENEQGYALGWRNYESNDILDEGVQIINHGGVSVGSQSLLIVFPEFDLVISLLMNKSKGNEKFQLFNYLNPIAKIFIMDIKSKARL